ncbi:MAG TPA: galactonate dehydratase [Thermomicrobiales bacterium]|nr:galactonate dehydratase [Thermomicrobiales bacterium]
MQITAIRNRFMAVERQNWHFVEVETDAGITGVGEASLEGRERTVAAAVDDLARLLLGQDPGPIEHHWQRLHRHGFWRGGVVLTSALSGIEQALWDIKGKALGVPVYELLGGPTRARVRVYTHCGGPTPEATAERAADLVAQGYTALKLGTARAGAGADERALIRRAARTLELVRQAVGPDVDLMLDNHGQMAPGDARALLRAVAPYDLLFLEEPTPPDNVAALAQLAGGREAVPLATGERLFTKWGYRELLERQLVDVVQPDVCHAGGILELRKIAALAETCYVKVAPHNPNGPVATAASLHVAASIPNFLILELARSEPHRTLVQREGLAVEGGWIALPRRPGLGVELDQDVIAAHPYRPHDYSGAYYADGAAADI